MDGKVKLFKPCHGAVSDMTPGVDGGVDSDVNVKLTGTLGVPIWGSRGTVALLRTATTKKIVSASNKVLAMERIRCNRRDSGVLTKLFYVDRAQKVVKICQQQNPYTKRIGVLLLFAGKISSRGLHGA